VGLVACIDFVRRFGLKRQEKLAIWVFGAHAKPALIDGFYYLNFQGL